MTPPLGDRDERHLMGIEQLDQVGERAGQPSSLSTRSTDFSCSSTSYRIGGSAFTIWIISGPVSPNLIACARIFSSMAALPTSPFNAAAIWRLIANSNLVVFLVRPFSRYCALALRKLRTMSPISVSRRLGRPRGLAQTPFLNWECRGGLR